MAQVCRAQQYPFTDDQAVALADWELYIQVRLGPISLQRSYVQQCTTSESGSSVRAQRGSSTMPTLRRAGLLCLTTVAEQLPLQSGLLCPQGPCTTQPQLQTMM